MITLPTHAQQGKRLACVAVAGAALLAPATASAATEPRGLFSLPVRTDPLDAGQSPLDLSHVSFAQRRTQLWLKVRTHGEWPPGALADDALCIDLIRTRVVGRVCLAGERGRIVLHLRAVAADGAASRTRTLPVRVMRPDRRTILAHLHPRLLALPYGKVRWVVRSGSDRAPDRGSYSARISSYGTPRCFGAAARARGLPCSNPVLRRLVTPSPGAALLKADAPCRPRPTRLYSVIVPCEFGARAEGRPAVALIGDSHTAHWRAAVEVVAQARGWRAISLTRAGCTFSTEAYPAPPPIPERCRRHSREAIRWLEAHPSVHTVVTSNSAGRGLAPGGFAAMWDQVPASVRRIVVIRDVPRVQESTRTCVAAVLRRRGTSARACGVPRARAFPADAAAQAAARAGGRVRLLDFSRVFCDPARCYPVIGGAYVYRDTNHMNPVFNATLGPYLLERLRAV